MFPCTLHPYVCWRSAILTAAARPGRTAGSARAALVESKSDGLIERHRLPFGPGCGECRFAEVGASSRLAPLLLGAADHAETGVDRLQHGLGGAQETSAALRLSAGLGDPGQIHQAGRDVPPVA